jgi:hypothetical protein
MANTIRLVFCRKRSVFLAAALLIGWVFMSFGDNTWLTHAGAASYPRERAGKEPSIRVGVVADALTGPTEGGSPPVDRAPVGAVRWLPHSNLNINYARGDFSDTERGEFHAAVALWQQALAQIDVGIVLSDGGEIDKDLEPVQSQIIVKRANSMDSGHYGKIVAFTRPDNHVGCAFILIRGSLHERASLRKTMLHELGHAFGLSDCPGCRSGVTVMNYFFRESIMGLKIGGSGSRISDRPTAGDISQVATGYRESLPAASRQNGEDEFARTLDSTLDLSAAYLKPAPALEPNQLMLASYLPAVPARSLDMSGEPRIVKSSPGGGANLLPSVEREPRQGILTAVEKTEFESYIPTVLRNEAATMMALNDYTFRRDVRIQTIDSKGRVSGEYHRISDVLFDDSGARIERGLSLPNPTLRKLMVSSEYVEDFSGAQLKGFELAKRDHYRIEPFMMDTIDGISMRVYRITPLNLNAERAAQARVFYGFAWVNQKTGKIVKIKGCALPDDKQRYPLFETQRELIDGVHLFPTLTVADDHLVFASHSVHVRMLITYTNYKKFASTVKITEVDGED